MDREVKYDLQKTCRTCLKTSNCQMFWSALNYNDSVPATNIEFPICIIDELSIMKLNIAPNDELPKQICLDCTNRVKAFNTFRIESKRSEKILEEYFKISTTFIKVEPITMESIVIPPPQLPVAHSQEISANTDFEFVDLNIKDELIGDKNNLNNNFNKFYNNYNNNNNNNNDINNDNENILKNEIDIRKSSEKMKLRDTVNNFLNNEQLQFFNLDNNEKSSVLSFEQDFNDDENDNDDDGKYYDVLEKQNLEVKDNQKIIRIGKFRSINNKNKKSVAECKEKIPKCKYCKEIFKTIEEMEVHLKSDHPIDRPHLCPICKKGFRKPSNRTDHLDTHVKEKAFKCDECESSFKSERALNFHKQKKHLIGEYGCPHCPRHFYSKFQYIKHIKRIHTSPTSLSMQQTSSQQRIPKNTTKMLKRFKCKLCEKIYCSLANLKDHERSHNGERPYLCNICGKDFVHSGTFATHLHIHKNERKHKCLICNKGFNLRSTLRTHSQVHADVKKPFKCKICESKFSRNTFLNKHIKLKHNLEDVQLSSTTTTPITTTSTNTEYILHHLKS